ncbi:MAG: hypothetical protein ACP5G0_08950 [Desulfomonilia bacterium]
MDQIVVSCAFCGRRYEVDSQDPGNWSCFCPCGAHGFVEEEEELAVGGSEEHGALTRDFATTYKNCVLFSDVTLVHIDEQFRRWYVCWYRLK